MLELYSPLCQRVECVAIPLLVVEFPVSALSLLHWNPFLSVPLTYPRDWGRPAYIRPSTNWVSLDIWSVSEFLEYPLRFIAGVGQGIPIAFVKLSLINDNELARTAWW